MSGFGGTVKLQGESEYKKALADITSNLKVLNSEMKIVTSQYDKNDKSTSNLAQQNEVLNKKIEEQTTKIAVLSKALGDSEQETGKNSETSKKWRVELNNAQAELNKLVKNVDDNEKAMKESEDATEDNTKAIDKFGKEADESGKSALKLGDIIKGNLISEGIMTGIKGLASAIKGVGSAFVNIGKQAIDSYGEYEQLVGGVNTLFGESGKKVQEYANNAYRTAGLSANQYMETVTSFSASMIASLNGDTEKASEVSNRAIIDMSDNANKMGTSMESIQNAYQGFAKQNYTMLDNLKLGYGGTKSEMQRLIKEASEMTDVQKELGITVDANDMSFANIANAISVVQKNMGIAGATSAEASTTMTGSMSAMKSAYQNLITGIADENANFDQLVNNLVVSIVGEDGEGGVLNNFLPRIETALGGIVQMVVSLTESLLPQVMQLAVDLITTLVTGINENLPALLESASTILNTLIDGVVSILPTLIPVALQMIMTLVTAILENLPTILDAGIEMLMSLVQGISSMLPDLIPLAINAVLNLVETLLDNIDLIIDTGIELIFALADGLLLALPDLIDKVPVIIEKLIMAVTNNLPKIIEMGIMLTIQLSVGLIKAIPQLIAKIPQIITSIVNGFKNYYSKLGDVGLNLVKGLWNGISNATSWILDKIKGFGNSVLNGIKSFFGIKSPSRVFRDEVGKNLALGLGEGFGDTMADVSAEMQNAVPTEFDTAINANLNAGHSYSSNYDMMVSAFKQALTEVKVVMNNREMGAFVTDTVERVVYS
jgi:phage-related protein